MSLEVGHPGLQRVLPIRQTLDLFRSSGTRLPERCHVTAHLALLGGNLFRLPQRVLDVALTARALLVLEASLGLTEPLERRPGLCRIVRVAGRGGPAHCIGSLLQTAGGVHHVGPVLLA